MSPPGEWIQRNGARIHIADMTTKHIEATIAMLERYNVPKTIGLGAHTKISEMKRVLEDRIGRGYYFTGCTMNFEPFSLGIEGERWCMVLPALYVGWKDNKAWFITRMDAKIKPWAVFCGHGNKGELGRIWHYFDHLITATAFIHEQHLTATSK